MRRLVKLAGLVAVASSVACSNNPTGPDGGSSTGSHGSGPGGASSGGNGSTGGTVGGSSGGGSSGGSSSGNLTLSQFENAYLTTLCQALEQCEPSATYVQDACATTYGSLLATAFADVGADIAAGRVAYSGTAAAACLAAASGAGCALFTSGSPSPAPCNQVFVGEVAAGAACYDENECDAGYCTVQDSNACPGVCTAYAAVGASCGGDGGPECSANSTCAYDGGSGSCVALPGAGADCSGTDRCQTGLVCVGGATCRAPGGAGAPCDSANGTEECQSGFYCNLFDGGSGSCAAQLGSGSACSASVAGVPGAFGGECAQGLVCAGYSESFTASGETTVAGTCVAASDVGGPCVLSLADAGVTVYYSSAVTGCLDGLACVLGSCVVPPTSGACASDLNAPCQTITSYCDPTGQCQPKQSTGASCNPQLIGGDCQSGYCDVQLPDGGTSQSAGTCAAATGRSCPVP
jgi:hypothetical protein